MSPPSVVRVEKWPTVNQVGDSQAIQFWWQPPIDTGGYPIIAYYINIFINGVEELSFGIDPTERHFTLSPSIYVKPRDLYSCVMWCLNENGEYSPYSEETYRVPAYQIPGNVIYPFLGMTSISTANTTYCVDYNNYSYQTLPNAYFITQIQNPTTLEVKQYPFVGNVSNVTFDTNAIFSISSLTEPWYRYNVRTFNYVDWDQPGLSDSYPLWQYFKYPYRYSGVSSLQVWIDISQQPRFLNDTQDFTYTFSNLAFTNYTFSGQALNPAAEGSALSNAQVFVNPGVISTSQLSEVNQLSNNAFTIFTVASHQYNGLFFRSRFSPSQAFGFSNVYADFCQMDGTPFVPGSIITEANTQFYIHRVSREPTTGFVTFGFNGSTISTSGQALSTLTDIYVNSETSYENAGAVQEIIYYNSNLPVQAQESLEGYLAWKWGLVQYLPPDHPYKNTKP